MRREEETQQEGNKCQTSGRDSRQVLRKLGVVGAML